LIFVKNRLVFGLISKVIKTVFKAIYKFLGFFNLHITMLVGILGAILYFTGVLTSSPAILLTFYILLIISVVIAIITSIRKLLGLGKKVEKKKGMQIVSTETAQENNENQSLGLHGESTEETVKPQETNKIIRKFFAKSNPNVLVYEYIDRFVLYLKTDGGYKYIRTDRK